MGDNDFTYAMIGLGLGLALGTKTGRELLAGIKNGFTIAMVPAPQSCKHPFVEVKKNKVAYCVLCHLPVKFPKGKDITKRASKK